MTNKTTKHFKHQFNPTVTNWAALSFPADPASLTTKLRREFRDTIQRCRGSDESFRQVLDNLEVLLAWARVKIEADSAENNRIARETAERAAEDLRRDEFRASIQAGPRILVTATSTGFIEQSPRTSAVLAAYDTATDPRGPVAAMAQMMIDEGRNPTSTLEINAFGRPGIGSGQTLQQLAATASQAISAAPATVAPGGLQGIRT